MSQSEADAAETIANTLDDKLIKPIPAIIHDFGLPPIGNNRPQDPLYVLLMLRRNMAREAKKVDISSSFLYLILLVFGTFAVWASPMKKLSIYSHPMS